MAGAPASLMHRQGLGVFVPWLHSSSKYVRDGGSLLSLGLLLPASDEQSN